MVAVCCIDNSFAVSTHIYKHRCDAYYFIRFSFISFSSQNVQSRYELTFYVQFYCIILKAQFICCFFLSISSSSLSLMHDSVRFDSLTSNSLCESCDERLTTRIAYSIDHILYVLHNEAMDMWFYVFTIRLRTLNFVMEKKWGKEFTSYFDVIVIFTVY